MKGKIMLNWAVTFLIIALIAAVLGFGGIAAASAEIAKIVFVEKTRSAESVRSRQGYDA